MSNDIDPKYKKTRDQIANWLEAAGDEVEHLPLADGGEDAWSFGADDGRQCRVAISQKLACPDVVLVGAMITLTSDDRQVLSRVDAATVASTLEQLRVVLLGMGVDTVSVENEPFPAVQDCFYVEDMTRTEAMRTIARVRRTALVIQVYIGQVLQEAPPSGDVGDALVN